MPITPHSGTLIPMNDTLQEILEQIAKVTKKPKYRLNDAVHVRDGLLRGSTGEVKGYRWAGRYEYLVAAHIGYMAYRWVGEDELE